MSSRKENGLTEPYMICRTRLLLRPIFGVTAVLHTWGQTLDHHPHVHCIVPGGGLSPDGARWIPCRSRFFLPVRVLSRLFRRLFLQALEASHASGQLQFFSRSLGCKRQRPLRPICWLLCA